MILLINKPFEYFLKITGLWPYDFHFVGPLAIVSAIISLLPFQFIKTLSLADDFLLMMNSLSDVLTESLILIKILILWMNKRRIDEVMKQIFDEWSVKSISKEWTSIAKYSRTFCTLNICSYLGAVFFYYLDVILAYINLPKENRKLILDAKYPFDHRSTPIYEIVFVVQTIQAFALAISDSLIQILLVALVLHVCAHIESLKSNIQKYANSCVKFPDDNNNESYGNEVHLKNIVKQHMKLLVLVNDVDAIYSYVSLSQLLFSNAIICVTEFLIITAAESANTMIMLKFSLFIVAMLTQAFTYCYAGQYLLNQGESILYPIYDCLWYNTDCKQIKTLTFVLSKAQTSLTLNAGGLFTLTLNSFLAILKTSFSYFSVLRAMYA